MVPRKDFTTPPSTSLESKKIQKFSRLGRLSQANVFQFQCFPLGDIATIFQSEAFGISQWCKLMVAENISTKEIVVHKHNSPFMYYCTDSIDYCLAFGNSVTLAKDTVYSTKGKESRPTCEIGKSLGRHTLPLGRHTLSYNIIKSIAYRLFLVQCGYTQPAH